MKTIVICASSQFYKHCNDIKAELEAKRFIVIVPATADQMAKTGDYDTDKIKTWYQNSSDFHIKSEKMRKHLNEVSKSDAILVINDEKNGIKSYIGPNCLIEMGLAFYLHKPIYLLNKVDKSQPLYEEVVGMDSIILNGKLSKIKLL